MAFSLDLNLPLASNPGSFRRVSSALAELQAIYTAGGHDGLLIVPGLGEIYEESTKVTPVVWDEIGTAVGWVEDLSGNANPLLQPTPANVALGVVVDGRKCISARAAGEVLYANNPGLSLTDILLCMACNRRSGMTRLFGFADNTSGATTGDVSFDGRSSLDTNMQAAFGVTAGQVEATALTDVTATREWGLLTVQIKGGTGSIEWSGATSSGSDSTPVGMTGTHDDKFGLFCRSANGGGLSTNACSTDVPALAVVSGAIDAATLATVKANVSILGGL